MKGLITFLKDIFSFSDDKSKVGLSQFNMSNEPKRTLVQKPKRDQNEVKLSDLMRRSY